MTAEQKRILDALALAGGMVVDMGALSPDTQEVLRFVGEFLARELCLDEMINDSPEIFDDLLDDLLKVWRR